LSFEVGKTKCSQREGAEGAEGAEGNLKHKETLINPSFVIPAKAGIQKFKDTDSGLRRNDGLFKPSLIENG